MSNSRTRMKTASRARLVAEFGLDLVKHERQVAVALNVLATRSAMTSSWVGPSTSVRSFLSRSVNRLWPKPSICGRTAAPQPNRLQGRHPYFLTAFLVHLLADNRLDFDQGAPGKR